MEVPKIADIGTGMTFKNHLPIRIPSLHHLKVKEREKGIVDDEEPAKREKNVHDDQKD